jgi:hypothetical protein
MVFRLNIPYYYNDLTLIHILEEVEHGMVTVQTLRPRTNFIMRLVSFPLLILVAFVYFISPVIFVILS